MREGGSRTQMMRQQQELADVVQPRVLLTVVRLILRIIPADASKDVGLWYRPGDPHSITLLRCRSQIMRSD